jgi:hypothetical protein
MGSSLGHNFLRSNTFGYAGGIILIILGNGPILTKRAFEIASRCGDGKRMRSRKIMIKGLFFNRIHGHGHRPGIKLGIKFAPFVYTYSADSGFSVGNPAPMPAQPAVYLQVLFLVIK